MTSLVASLLCVFQVANNYFAHFFAPQNLTNLNKNLVFVIDISTSMEGQKVKQVNVSFNNSPGEGAWSHHLLQADSAARVGTGNFCSGLRLGD